MPTKYRYILVCCLSIGLITTITAQQADSSNNVNRLLTLQTKLQKLQDDVSSSLTALQTPTNDNVITLNSSAIEGGFQFLKKELADIIETPSLQDGDESESNSFDQSSSDVIEYIRRRQFDTAEEKLKQINNLQEVPRIIAAVYENNADNFDLLAEFIENLSDINLIYASVNALQREMFENDHIDPYKSIRLAKVLETRFMNVPVDYFKTEFAQFTYNELKETIIDSTLDALNDAVSRPEFIVNEETNNLTAAVYHYDPEQWESIIYEFVNTNTGNHSRVLDVINSQSLMEQRVSGVSTLYWSIQFNHNPESEVIIRIASILKEILSDSEYQSLRSPLKDLVDNIMENLPTCAKNMFFLPSACLWNKGAEAYLTAVNSSSSGHKRHRGPKVFSTEPMPGSHWYFEKNDTYFVISNRAFKDELLFAANAKHAANYRHVFNRLFKNRTKTDERTKWLIELDNDYCYVKSAKHNEYLITSEIYFEDSWRYVFTWAPRTLLEEPRFQWQIRACE